MSYCPNCKTKITCGCQKAKANDGTQVCSNCVKSYNMFLASGKKGNIDPKVAPQNVTTKVKRV